MGEAARGGQRLVAALLDDPTEVHDEESASAASLRDATHGLRVDGAPITAIRQRGSR